MLRAAIHRAEGGRIDANLGSGVIKQRLARPGQGRSGGFRVLAAYRAGEIAVFLYGFAKSERDNVDGSELDNLRKAARFYFGLTDDDLDLAAIEDKLMEVQDV